MIASRRALACGHDSGEYLPRVHISWCILRKHEPSRERRRLFALSSATMAGCSSVA